MNEMEYSILFLKEKLKDSPFQVWGYNDINNYQYLIYNNGKNLPLPPSILYSNKEENSLKIVKERNRVILYYFYPEGNQVSVCVYLQSIPLSEEERQHLYYFFYLFLSNKTIDRKDNQLYNLINSIHSITSSLDLDEVLEKIIINALKVFPAADAGLLFLYDEVSKRLTPKAPIGFNNTIYNVKFKVGESITGKVFEDGEGRIFNSQKEVYEEMAKNNISTENFDYITAGKSPEAAMCVPVSIADKRIGVMLIHQWNQKKIFVDHDLQLLQGFAEQTAIAIQNAKYYTEANKRLVEVTELSKELQEKNIQLQKRYEVHQALMNISLQNQGVEKIIYELNHMIKPSLSFFNALENKFYSNKKTHSPFSIFEINIIFMEKRNSLHVTVSNCDSNRYLLYPIYNGIAFLGCFIVNLSEPLSMSDQMTLEQGSSVLALELVKKQTIAEIFYKKSHEQFQSLLNYKDEEHLIQQANEIGITISSYCFIAILEIPVYSDLQLLEVEIHQLVSKIKSELMISDKLIYGFHNKVILLLSSIELDDLNQIQTKIHSIRKEYKKNNNTLFRGGISSTYKGLYNVKKCYEEANKTLSYLADRNRNDIICYEDIGLNRLFLNQSSQEIEQFVHDVLSPLRSDNDRNKDLEKTLLTYIEYNRSATKTAKDLHIHINTLYQRLKKMEDLLQIDFQNNEDVLKIQLACHLEATYNQS
ncbi:sugar diacid utilization regulator [Evansella vedderi]|uniref:Sugar diacid utilization regulator n=1 Tax=Evansella vedderi TaxID=38282 RepID=A0ABT9ZYR6_9BACI|nr:helix-turn-helix domain-containing protein [Evansella vedderi]MDQ0256396.1 sugar diacid utilization regulator [Evansella vedderi]